MFYIDEPNYNNLRFGDVIEGKALIALYLDKKKKESALKLDVNVSDIAAYNVILTPCCAIRDGVITLVPLTKIQSIYYRTPLFEENMLNINEMSPPHKHFSPAKLEQRKDKAVIMQREPCYPFPDLFIYAPDDKNVFSAYNLSDKDKGEMQNVRYYMIDFKNSYKLYIKDIASNENFLLKSKKLELSIDTRKKLIDKIKSFYRIAPEDFE